MLQNGYSLLASTIAFAVLARIIGPANFGLAALAQVFIAIALLFSDFGVTPSLIRLPEVTDEQLCTGFWIGLALGLLFAAALEVLAPELAHWLHEPRLSLILRVVALSIPVSQLLQIPTAILSRDLKMRPQASRQIVSVTVATVGALILAVLGAGVWALVFQDFGTLLIDLTMLWRAVEWRPRLVFSRRDASSLLRFGLQVTATNVVSQGRDRVVQLLIGSLLGARDLGYWSVASQISNLATQLFASAVNAVALPGFARVQNDPERLARALRHGVRILGTMSIPALCALGAASPQLIPAVFGQRWHVVAGLAAITTITAAINIIQWLDGNVWWAVGRPRTQMYLTWFITVLHIAAVWLFVRHGLIAIAWALMARSVLSFALRVVLIVRGAKMPLSCYADIPAIVFCTALMYLGMRIVGNALPSTSPLLVIGLEVAAGLAIYLAASSVTQRENLAEFVQDFRHVIRRPKPA